MGPSPSSFWIFACFLLFPLRFISTSTDCDTQLSLLAPCLTYVEVNNHEKPDSSCCKGLASVVQTSASCLCQLSSGATTSAAGVNVNSTRAEELPSLCSVKLPASTASCNAAGTSSSSASSTQATPAKKTSNSSSSSSSSDALAALLTDSWVAVTLMGLISSLLYL